MGSTPVAGSNSIHESIIFNFSCLVKAFTFCRYHISNDYMRISNQCNNVNSHLVILSDECCTQVVYYETKCNNMSNLQLLTL